MSTHVIGDVRIVLATSRALPSGWWQAPRR
jgi:hypothetical protein